MQEKKIEIRTPNEHLLIFTVVEKNGEYLVEVKNRCKIDFIKPEAIINSLLDYNKNINNI